MSQSNHDRLSNLLLLERAIFLIDENNNSLSFTKIKNQMEEDEHKLWLSLEMGVKEGFLKRESGNYYSKIADFTISEIEYYPSIQSFISELWLDEKHEKSEFYIENTSAKDSKISGRWTRPDLTLISCKNYSWTIGVEFDIVTFEVKKPNSANVLAVFEALAHSAAATRSYVVFPLSRKDLKQKDEKQEQRIREECARHGVGLILIENIKTKPTAIHEIRARKKEIDHEKCDDFLRNVMSDSGKDIISKWKRL